MSQRIVSDLARTIVDDLWGVFLRKGLILESQRAEAEQLVQGRIDLDREMRLMEFYAMKEGRCE